MGTNKNVEAMASGKLLPLILKYAWPAIVTMTINQLYNVVDRIYIGQGCGTDAIAGLALTFPVMGFLAAIGVLIGMGSSTIISIKLGERDMDGAERALGQCVAMKLIFGFIFPVAFYFFGMDPVLRKMAGEGVTKEAFDFAHLYLSITLFFNMFAHLAFGLSACMRAEGAPKRSMTCLIVGCVTNIILDPFFIFKTIPFVNLPGLGMGVAGAAWATNIAMFVACITAMSYYASGKSAVKLRLSKIRIFKDIFGRMLAIGQSPFLMQMMGAIIVFSINFAFKKWSPTREEGTMQICAFGISSTVSLLFSIPTFGLQQGMVPILGYNWGAKNFARVRSTLMLGLWLTAGTCLLMFLGCQCFARPLSRCFASDPATIDAASRTLRLANMMIWSIFVNVAATTYFQAVGRPRTAIVLSLLRQCLCLLPIVWILPYYMEDHVLAIWLALPISDIVAQVATLPPLIKEIRFLAYKQLRQNARA